MKTNNHATSARRLLLAAVVIQLLILPFAAAQSAEASVSSRTLSSKGDSLGSFGKITAKGDHILNNKEERITVLSGGNYEAGIDPSHPELYATRIYPIDPSVAISILGANVGIGTDQAGGSKLNVNGTGRFHGALYIRGLVHATGGVQLPDGAVINSKDDLGKWDGDKPGNIYYTDGNVGIGTTAPGAKFEVYNESLLGYSAIRITEGYSGDSIWELRAHDQLNGIGESFSIWGGGRDGSAERVTILRDGKVGIGTVSPGNKLEITGNSTLGWLKLSSTSGNPEIVSQYALLFKTGNTAPTLFLANGGASIGSGYGQSYAPPINGLLVEGNVGIGTATPNNDYALDVFGVIGINGEGALNIGTETNMLNVGGGFATVNLYSGAGIKTLTTYNGSVGIGTIPTTASKLDVNGDIKALSITLGGSTSKSEWPSLLRCVSDGTTIWGLCTHAKNACTIEITCPTGYTAIGGGGECKGTMDMLHISMATSDAVWRVSCHEALTADCETDEISKAYASCLKI